MANQIKAGLLGALIVTLTPQVAAAWDCVAESCPVQCELPITYAIANLPAGVNEAQAVADIQRAFDAWNAPDCVDFGMQYLGRAGEIAEMPHLMIDTLDPWPDPEFGSVNVTHAVATLSTDMQGCIEPYDGIEASINLNDEGFNWSTDQQGGTDLYSVMLQQVGLSLGIGNAGPGALSVVRGSYMGPITTGILADDENAICYLYADGEVGPNEPGATVEPPPEGCPDCTQSRCGPDSACAAVGGDSTPFCLVPCQSDADCTSGTCLPVYGGVCVDGTQLVCGSQAPGMPDLGLPTADMGSSEPDMGTATVDLGAGESDMGSNASDLGSDDDPDSGAIAPDDEEGGCGCGTTGAAPGSLLLFAVGFAFIRRRR